jgi:hypothetical protein
MAKKGGIGKLSLDLILDPTGFSAGLRNATTVVKGFDKTVQKHMGSVAKSFAKPTQAVNNFAKALPGPLKAIGALTVGVGGTAAALFYFAKSQGDVLDAGAKVADSLGIATEKFFGLRLAGDLSGVSAEQFDTSMSRLTKTLSAAAFGAQKNGNAFTQLGLDARKLALMPLDDALLQISDRIAALPTTIQKARAAFAIFGKSGLAMLPMLAGGAGGLKEAIADAKAFGWAIDRTVIARIEVLNDNLTRIGWAFKGIGAQLAARIAPYLAAATNQALDWVRNIGGVPALFDMAEKAIRKGIIAAGEFVLTLKKGFIEAKIGFEEFVFTAQSGITKLYNAIVGLNNAVPWSQKISVGEMPDAKAHASRMTALVYERSMAELAPNPSEKLLKQWDVWSAKVKESVVSSRPKLDMRGISEDMFDEGVADKPEKKIKGLGDTASDSADKFGDLEDAAKSAAKATSGSFGQGSLATIAFGRGGSTRRAAGGDNRGFGNSIPGFNSAAYQRVVGSRYQLAKGIGAQQPASAPMSQGLANYRAAGAYVPGFVDVLGGGKGDGEATGLLRKAVGHLARLDQGQSNPSRRQAAYAG